MTANMKQNTTDTENTRKRIPKKSIENGKNIDINPAVKMTAILMRRNGGHVQIPVVIMIVNIDIQIRMISTNHQMVIRDSINESTISGNYVQ